MKTTITVVVDEENDEAISINGECHNAEELLALAIQTCQRLDYSIADILKAVNYQERVLIMAREGLRRPPAKP